MLEKSIVGTSPFKDRIIERKVGACTLYMLPVEVENVVSWRGAFMSNPSYAEGDDIRQGLTVSLLDKGTKQHDRFAIAEILENRGAHIHFHNGGIGIGFSARCLKRDFRDVMEVLADELYEPLFDEEEFKKAGMQIAASLHRSLERPGSQAYSALCRKIYPTSHPNYAMHPEEELQKLAGITLESVKDYHTNHFGANDFIMVVVGDIDPEAVTRTVESLLGSWTPHEAPATYSVRGEVATPEEVRIPMVDKSSIDVRLGHAVEVRLNSEEYVPLHLGNFILGGNFSSRLMDIIRDQKGLTYGIRSGLNGISRYYEGHWQVNVTLSLDKLNEGIEETRKVVDSFVREGVSEQELEQKKTTIIGTFKVELATTGGLAVKILRGVQNGFGAEYLDTYPELVRQVTLEEVNQSIRRHIDLKKAHLTMAGTLS